jgi:phospholipase C
MGLSDIKHVVVIVQENHSFDQYFGTLLGARGLFDPWIGAVLPQRSGGQNWYPYAFPSGTVNLAGFDHDFPSHHLAWSDGSMSGFVDATSPECMGYLSEQDIPFHFWLAKAFTLCDHYFCSVMGPTGPNRLYLMSGSCGSRAETNYRTWYSAAQYGYPYTPDYPPTWLSYPQALDAAGLSGEWAIYNEVLPASSDPNNTPYMLNVAANFPDASTSPNYKGLDAFETDVAAGQLPLVSWLIFPYSYTEHPGGSTYPESGNFNFQAGGYWLYRKLQTLWANGRWNDTVVIVAYDENDGAFDHVPPPVSPPGTPGEWATNNGPGEWSPGTGPPGPIGPGFRVPTLIVSPWTVGGRVCGDVFDHTSVLRFLELVTGVECANISAYRRAFMGDLTAAFDFESTPPDHPPVYSSPYPLPEPPANGWAAPNTDNPDSPAMNTLTPFTPASFEVTPIPPGPFTLPAVLSPGLAFFQGVLYAAWKGEAGDDRLFYSSLTEGTWQPQQAISGNSSGGVSLASYGDALFAAWKGERDDQRLFYSAMNASGIWAPQSEIPGNSSVGPSLCAVGDRLYVLWKGEQQDKRIFISSYSAGAWESATAIPGNTSAGLGLANWNGSLWVAWKGEFTDQRLFVSSFDGATWTRVTTIPGNSSMGPSLAVFEDKLCACWKGEIPDLYRFFHGELSDQRLFFSTLAEPGGAWSPVSAIPGNSSISPALATSGKQLVAIWKGELLDQRIFAGTFDGQSWTFGGILPGNTSPDWE